MSKTISCILVLIFVSAWLSGQRKIDLQVGSDSLIFSAIEKANDELLEQLLSDGTDPNIRDTNGQTLLMKAAHQGSRPLAKLLLRYGANVHLRDYQGATPLMFGAISGKRNLVKLLVKHGSVINERDNDGKTAFDYAILHSNSKVADYLKIAFERNLPYYFDGPHIKTNRKGTRAKVYYYLNDPESGRASTLKQKMKSTDRSFAFKGTNPDTLSYTIAPIALTTYEFDGIDSLLVVGDIHGGYDDLIQLLLAHNIVTPALKWNWGENHLVFIGDIFDRGEKVTETLWLIYHLQRQAMKENGRVHYILGNHELLILQGKVDYIAEKYFYLADKLNYDYSYLFSKKYELGKWLRQQPSMVRINGNLFVHAGIHPLILQYPYSIKEINHKINYYLKKGIHYKNREDLDFLTFMTGNHGPFWYRNMVHIKNREVIIDSITIDRALEHFNAERIIIGHTNVPEITSYYNGKVFFTDVPYYNPYFRDKGNIQGLLIREKQVHSIFKDGTLKPVPEQN